MGKVKTLIILLGVFCSSYVFAADTSPWPAIRQERIASLLPAAMKAANVEAWIIICRENNNDPLADHIGGENAGGTATFVFYQDEKGFHSIVFSPSSESSALDDLDIHDKVISVDRSLSTVSAAAKFIQSKNFITIAINSSSSNAQADGLTYSQRVNLEKVLGNDISKRLVSSEELVYQWLSIKLPAEVDILRKAAEMSRDFQLEAYKQIIPGKSTEADIARFLKAKMKEHGVKDGWAPDQNPNVNAGPDRGHSHSSTKIIMPGDVIQIDFGVKLYDRWVSDIQRFGYVLHPGKSEAPKEIEFYWKSGRDGGKAAFMAMKPGVKGEDVDRAQHILMDKAGSLPIPWSTGHPVGYVAHDTGPNLGGSQLKKKRPSAQRILKPGMVFAFDGFHAWKRKDGTLKTISVEEMAVITMTGAEYLILPQQELILIKSK